MHLHDAGSRWQIPAAIMNTHSSLPSQPVVNTDRIKQPIAGIWKIQNLECKI